MEKPFIFRSISKFFRLLEIFFALLLLPWLWSQFPFVAKISATFVFQLITVAKSPIFIFTLFNFILVSLYIKSSQFTGNSNSGDVSEADLYDEFVTGEVVCFSLPNLSLEKYPEEVMYQDKEMIDVASESEDLVRESVEEGESEKVLRRPEEEKFDEVTAEDLSSDEFKRTVEDFIAKQMRFHFEEKMAIVAC